MKLKIDQIQLCCTREVPGSLHPSQLPATPKGTTQLLRLQVGDVSSLSPHPDVAGGWAPLVAEGGPQVQRVPTGWVLRPGS